MSKPRNPRLWLSSPCAVPRQPDEALAKSSAKQINFSRNAGSLISRNAFIKRTPSLGSAASDSRNLLTCSPRLIFIVLGFILRPIGSEPIVPTFAWAEHFIQRASFTPLVPSRYISNKLIDERGSSRTSKVQPNMLYQNRQVVFIPNFCHSRASISSNSTVRLSALRACQNSDVLEDSCKVGAEE